MKKLIGLSLLVVLGVLAAVPSWSVVKFAISMAENENVARNTFVLLAILSLIIIVVIVYKLLLTSNDDDPLPRPNRKKPAQTTEQK